MEGVHFTVMRLSGNEPGHSSFPTSSDGKTIACTLQTGLQDALTYRESVKDAYEIVKPVVNVGWLAANFLGGWGKEFTKAERTEYGFPGEMNNQAPGLTVSELWCNQLDDISIGDGLTYLPRPAFPRCVPECIDLFRDDERDFKTVDDLLLLSFDELGRELHICAIDAPLTIDDASMIYGQMMDQERYGDPADYASESDGSDESDGDASDGEGVDDAPGDVDYATSQEV